MDILENFVGNVGWNPSFCFDGICVIHYLWLFIAVCRESCLNGGRCIGPDRCACIYGYTGRKCEAGNLMPLNIARDSGLIDTKEISYSGLDYRTGPCFTKITGNICGSQLLGVVCTRQLCCATVGKAWGHPCEPCPDYLDCEPGHLKNIHSSQCIDIGMMILWKLCNFFARVFFMLNGFQTNARPFLEYVKAESALIPLEVSDVRWGGQIYMTDNATSAIKIKIFISIHFNRFSVPQDK